MNIIIYIKQQSFKIYKANIDRTKDIDSSAIIAGHFITPFSITVLDYLDRKPVRK